jgi:hypothetical protein
MAQEIELKQEEREALDLIDSELRGRPAKGVGLADIGDLCQQYQKLRPTLAILIQIVKKIPGIGARIATVLEFLMGIADLACPVQ